jgi:hypothetical protein
MSQEALAWAGVSPADATPLPGDASTRDYYRVSYRGAKLVLMAFADDEVSRDQARRYLDASKWLMRLGIPVPAILDASEDLRFVLQEDLGDLTLEAWLAKEPPPARIEAKYRTLMRYLRIIQASATPEVALSAPPLDEAMLRRELEFFREHHLDGRRDDRLDLLFARLAGAATSISPVAAHRDYHSRNIMVKGERLFLVDFQDARLAHPLYDLASLLFDAYVDVGDTVRDSLLSEWCEPRDMAAVALQRNLKAVGTFSYQMRVRRKDFYGRFIPRCLEYARRHLRTLEWREEQALLDEVLV